MTMMLNLKAMLVSNLNCILRYCIKCIHCVSPDHRMKFLIAEYMRELFSLKSAAISATVGLFPKKGLVYSMKRECTLYATNPRFDHAHYIRKKIKN